MILRSLSPQGRSQDFSRGGALAKNGPPLWGPQKHGPPVGPPKKWAPYIFFTYLNLLLKSSVQPSVFKTISNTK